jgi:hypothetical protein
VTGLDGQEEPQTDEEQFVKTVVNNKQLHAKAKLIIMQFIGMILNESHKI